MQFASQSQAHPNYILKQNSPKQSIAHEQEEQVTVISFGEISYTALL